MVASRGCRPASIPTTTSARTRTARRRSSAWSRARGRCSTSSSRTALGGDHRSGRVATLERVAELLVRVKNQTKRELYAGQLAGVLGLQPHQVARALREAAHKASRPCRRSRPRPPRPRLPLAPAQASGRRAAGAGAARPVTPSCCARPRRPRRRAADSPAVPPAVPRRGRAGRARTAKARRAGLAGHGAAGRAGDRRGRADGRRPGRRPNPASLLREVGDVGSSFLRVDAEMSMNTRLQREAQARGDDAALRALARGHRASKNKRRAASSPAEALRRK